MTAITFKPSQELTFDTVMQNKRRVQDLLKSSPPQAVHIDMTGVEGCDSAGIAFLIEAKKLCRQKGVSLEIEGMTPELISLAQFSGVMSVLM